jgi:hypothetical protein
VPVGNPPADTALAERQARLTDINECPVGIPIWFSLTFIIGTLLITTVASLIKSRYDEDSADATPLDQPASADKPELEPVDAVDR